MLALAHIFALSACATGIYILSAGNATLLAAHGLREAGYFSGCDAPPARRGGLYYKKKLFNYFVCYSGPYLGLIFVM